MIYDNNFEQEKVLGKISENSFIKTKKAEREQIKKEVNSIISNLNSKRP